MPVSKEDREAYETGVEESQRDSVFDVLFGTLLDFTPETRWSESQQAAYDKGRNGEQLDEDKDQ